MTPRPKKNLLEAFQASTRGPAEAPAPGHTPPASATSTAPRVKSPVLDGLPAASERRRIEPVLAASAGALLLVIAFFLGRFSVGDRVLAANDDATPDNVAADSGALDLELDQPPVVDDSASDSPPVVEDDTHTAADRAFYEPANRVTVCAQRYGMDENARWNADYYQLLDLGIPVVQPVHDRNGKWIVLCVGAEPSKNATIKEILARLEALPAFSSPYVDNIDNVTER